MFDFTKAHRHERLVADLGIALPDNAPKRFGERGALWNEVERVEKKADAQLAEANARVAELAGKLASLAERQQAIAATPWWRRGRMAMKLLGPGGE